MKLELLKQADWVLNACGRPVPPAGYRFVDLPRVIPFHYDSVHPTVSGGQVQPIPAPYNQAITNNSDTVFLCRGIALNSQYRVRIKWPSGRYLSKLPQFGGGEEASPQGTGSSMLAFPNEVPIGPDQRVTVQITGNEPGTNVDAHFWGVLRYLLKDDSAGGDGGSANGGTGDASCIIGYPTVIAKSNAGIDSIADPVEALKDRPRYQCTPNGNIMAPEWALGNQCTPETPDGYQDESFTFFSPLISIPGNASAPTAGVYGVETIVPGSTDDVIIKSLTFFVTLAGDGYSAIPILELRLPNGYSVMGGDQIPVVTDFNFIPSVFQLPVFPTLRVRAGDRLIIDASNSLVTASGVSTVLVQFDGCKRRRRTA